MSLVEVRGKSTRRLRKVFILLTPGMREGLAYLISNRENVDIMPNNPFVFARQNTTSPISGCEAMRKVTDECPGLVDPGSIRTRQLRKYFATTLQVKLCVQWCLIMPQRIPNSFILLICQNVLLAP